MPFLQRTDSPSIVAALLKKYGFTPLKNLGQNFLIDANITDKIAAAAVPCGSNALEVGMGLCALTRAVSSRASKVVTVEIDRGFVTAAPDLLDGETDVVIVEGDILKVDIGAIARENFGETPFYVCGNLPYYITAPVIMRFLESGLPIMAITAMVQKEVARKLTALPGSADYGAITAACAYFGNARYLFTVSKNCFLPKPKVDSAVVKLSMGFSRRVPYKQYSRVVRAAFSMRRKTLYNNLKALFGDDAEEALKLCGIPENARAQEVSPDGFLKLAGML